MHGAGGPPSAARDWPSTVAAAQRAAGGGHYRDAEQMLARFTEQYPGAREAQEAHYWRAIFMLDPANQARDAQRAVTQLDAYLASGSGLVHRPEAQVLRRLALALDSLSRVPVVVVASPTDTVVRPSAANLAHEQALEKENEKLKDQLEKTNAELDRIKKRLAAPKPDSGL